MRPRGGAYDDVTVPRVLQVEVNAGGARHRVQVQLRVSLPRVPLSRVPLALAQPRPAPPQEAVQDEVPPSGHLEGIPTDADWQAIGFRTMCCA